MECGAALPEAQGAQRRARDCVGEGGPCVLAGGPCRAPTVGRLWRREAYRAPSRPPPPRADCSTSAAAGGVEVLARGRCIPRLVVQPDRHEAAARVPRLGAGCRHVGHHREAEGGDEESFGGDWRADGLTRGGGRKHAHQVAAGGPRGAQGDEGGGTPSQALEKRRGVGGVPPSLVGLPQSTAQARAPGPWSRLYRPSPCSWSLVATLPSKPVLLVLGRDSTAQARAPGCVRAWTARPQDGHCRVDRASRLDRGCA